MQKTYPVVYINHDFLFPHSVMLLDSSAMYYRDLFEDCRINNRNIVIWNNYDGKNPVACLAKVHSFEVRENNQVVHHLVGLKKCIIKSTEHQNGNDVVKIEEFKEDFNLATISDQEYVNLKRLLMKWFKRKIPEMHDEINEFKKIHPDINVMVNKITDLIIEDVDLKLILLNIPSMNEQISLIYSLFKEENLVDVNPIMSEAIKMYYNQEDSFRYKLAS